MLFYTLGDDIDAQFLSQHDDGAGNFGCLFAVAKVFDEGAIYLDGGKRKLIQVAQRGLAAAKIINGNGDAKIS